MKYKTKNMQKNYNKNLKIKVKSFKLNVNNINNFFDKSLNKYKLLVNFNNELDKRANKFYINKFNTIYLDSKYKNNIKFYKGLHNQLNLKSKI